MSRIDFYVLDHSEPDGRLRLACRLADKAFRQGCRIYVNAENPAQAARLDELMWTYRDDSFLPHALAGSKAADGCPVSIGCGDHPATDATVLINLGGEVPTWFTRFERVTELVDAEPAMRRIARDRFRHYRAQGCEPQTHQLKT